MTNALRRLSCGFCGFGVFALLLGAFGCDSAEPGGAAGHQMGDPEGKGPALPHIEVKLPPSPSFQKDNPPEVYADQSLSVYGVRRQMKAQLDKTVRVKGFLVELYECPVCPKGAECKPCAQPHFWIADRADAGKDKALMVTNYTDREPKGRTKLKLTVGQAYFVTGRFAKSSGTGFTNSEGLIVFESAEPVEGAGAK